MLDAAYGGILTSNTDTVSNRCIIPLNHRGHHPLPKTTGACRNCQHKKVTRVFHNHHSHRVAIRKFLRRFFVPFNHIHRDEWGPLAHGMRKQELYRMRFWSWGLRNLHRISEGRRSPDGRMVLGIVTDWSLSLTSASPLGSNPSWGMWESCQCPGYLCNSQRALPWSGRKNVTIIKEFLDTLADDWLWVSWWFSRPRYSATNSWLTAIYPEHGGHITKGEFVYPRLFFH